MDNLNQIHKGVIKLNGHEEYEIQCYVVDNGEKVERYLSQSEVVKLISGGRESGNLQRYLASSALQDTLPKEIREYYNNNILIINTGLYSVNGVRASTVVDICNAYLRARQLGLLKPNQIKLAEQSEIFISALAKTGIDAVIDEATGYQYFRKANDLQAKLDAYIVEGYREWTRTFPREFFMHLYRLEGKTPPQIDQPYPKRFGKYMMQFVYDTLDPEIADYLRENNPSPGGKKHHHQKFNDFGYKALTDHLFSVLGIAKASINMDKFKENLLFAFPNAKVRKMARLAINREKKKENKSSLSFLPTPNSPRQMNLFDMLEENSQNEKNNTRKKTSKNTDEGNEKNKNTDSNNVI